MAGDRIVVSYAAIQAAQREFTAAVESAGSALGAVSSVGGETLHAKKLDEALTDYRSKLNTVGRELHLRLGDIAAFLASSERVYRYVDETALTRAVPYDPKHPAPTMVVSKSTTPFSTGLSLSNGGSSGTTTIGVPAGTDGGGTPVAAHPTTTLTATGLTSAATGKDATGVLTGPGAVTAPQVHYDTGNPAVDGPPGEVSLPIVPVVGEAAPQEGR